MTDLFQRDLDSITSNPSSRQVSDVNEDEEDEKEEEELVDRDNLRRCMCFMMVGLVYPRHQKMVAILAKWRNF